MDDVYKRGISGESDVDIDRRCTLGEHRFAVPRAHNLAFSSLRCSSVAWPAQLYKSGPHVVRSVGSMPRGQSCLHAMMPDALAAQLQLLGRGHATSGPASTSFA